MRILRNTNASFPIYASNENFEHEHEHEHFDINPMWLHRKNRLSSYRVSIRESGESQAWRSDIQGIKFKFQRSILVKPSHEIIVISKNRVQRTH